MSNPSAYKLACARGIGDYLQGEGITRFNDAETLKIACDNAASLLPPHVDEGRAPSDDDVYKVAQAILNQHEAAAPMGKVASHQNHASRLNHSIDYALGDIFEKVSREVVAMAQTPAPLYPNGYNSLRQAANVHPLGMLDQRERPNMYAMAGRGNTNLDQHVPAGARVGNERPHPGAEGYTSYGQSSNDIINSSKSAGFREIMKRAMSGAIPSTNTAMTPNGANDSIQAATTHPMGTIDLANRPDPYAMAGAGNTNINQHATPQSVVGDEEPHPQAQGHLGAATNDVVESSKTAAWRQHFQKTAEYVEPHLPAHMPSEDRVRVIKHAMSLEPQQVDGFIRRVQQQYSAPEQVTAGSLLNSLSNFR